MIIMTRSLMEVCLSTRSFLLWKWLRMSPRMIRERYGWFAPPSVGLAEDGLSPVPLSEVGPSSSRLVPSYVALAEEDSLLHALRLCSSSSLAGS
jgi:hypothetical protein